MTPLSFDSTLDLYQKQAEDLLAAWRAGASEAVQIIRHNHPRFLDERIGWLPKDQSEDELRAAPFDLVDARLALARWYNFADWQALADYAAAVTEKPTPVSFVL